MAILKTKSDIANANNVLTMTDGADLCCGDNTRSDYASAAVDMTASTAATVDVQVPGASAQEVALDGAPIDWTDSDNDAALIAALGKVATDLGYEWFDGGIEIDRSAGDDSVVIKIKDSTLIWVNIASTAATDYAFTGTEVS